MVAIVGMSLAACGRFGFDTHLAEGDAPVDINPDSPLADAQGFWIVTDAVLEGESAQRSRDDAVAGIRADFTIDQTQVVGRALALEGGVASGTPAVAELTLTIDGDRWVLSNDGTAFAYTITWTDADHARLVDDPAYPGTFGPPPPFAKFTIERATPPPSALPGAWTLARVRYPGAGEVEAGTCVPDGTGTAIVTGTVTTTSALLLEIKFKFVSFDALDCAGSGVTSDDGGPAYLEATATRYSLWMTLSSVGEIASEGDLVATSTGFRFARTSCAPEASCSDLPLLIELAP